MSPIAYRFGATILKATDVSLNLGGRAILRDLSLEIRDIIEPGRVTGQIVSLLGPSGIGKTRLFRILAGLDQPTSGTVLIGEDLQPVQRGKMGVVAQDYPLFTHRTVRGNLEVAGTMAGLSSETTAARAHSFLERFDLTRYAHRYPTELSGGERQRVAIAQQFMCSDHFLLLDEPFSGLDPLAIDKVIELIVEVANADELNTIIVVTHDIHAAMAVSDHIWLLGRDRDADGQMIPGARLQKSYCLLDHGLSWCKGIDSTPEFLAMQAEIRNQFAAL